MIAKDSIEILFWMPTILDLLLLISTYGYCTTKGVSWYLETQKDIIVEQKKKDDDNTIIPEAYPEVHSVWELAMAAYTAYACLFPLAIYWCYKYPMLRVSFCWTMTVLMMGKTYILCKSSKTIVKSKREEGIKSLIIFYFPTYGGYALFKTFILES